MKINILTLFPEFFTSFKEHSIVKRAVERGQVELNIINIRYFAEGKHKQCDDIPFGGGAGMVMKPEPILKALEGIDGEVIYMSPQGERFDQKMACDLSNEKEITIIAGHYEGIDERVIEKRVTKEISLGDFVLTGGELPAMVISDTIIRLLPGVIKKESYENDSFYNGLLDYPHYTRPAEYDGMKVPDVLMSGHHKNIDEWRLKQSLKRTLKRRPELLKNRDFSKLEKKLLKEIDEEMKSDI